MFGFLAILAIVIYFAVFVFLGVASAENGIWVIITLVWVLLPLGLLAEDLVDQTDKCTSIGYQYQFNSQSEGFGLCYKAEDGKIIYKDPKETE